MSRKRQKKRIQRDKPSQVPKPPDRAERPSGERLRRGKWALPQGAMKSEQPFVDLTVDAVGRLYEKGLLTAAEEQAARQFQAARAAYLEELPDVSGFKSCIAGSVPGYDDGEGDPVVIERYRDLEKRIGVGSRRIVLQVCEDNVAPKVTLDLMAFKRAMGRISR